MGCSAKKKTLLLEKHNQTIIFLQKIYNLQVKKIWNNVLKAYELSSTLPINPPDSLKTVRIQFSISQRCCGWSKMSWIWKCPQTFHSFKWEMESSSSETSRWLQEASHWSYVLLSCANKFFITSVLAKRCGFWISIDLYLNQKGKASY